MYSRQITPGPQTAFGDLRICTDTRSSLSLSELTSRRLYIVEELVRLHEILTNTTRDLYQLSCSVVEKQSASGPQYASKWQSIRSSRRLLKQLHVDDLVLQWRLRAVELRMAAYQDFSQDVKNGGADRSKICQDSFGNIGWAAWRDEHWAHEAAMSEIYRREQKDDIAPPPSSIDEPASALETYSAAPSISKGKRRKSQRFDRRWNRQEFSTSGHTFSHEIRHPIDEIESVECGSQWSSAMSSHSDETFQYSNRQENSSESAQEVLTPKQMFPLDEEPEYKSDIIQSSIEQDYTSDLFRPPLEESSQDDSVKTIIARPMQRFEPRHTSCWECMRGGKGAEEGEGDGNPDVPNARND